MVELVAIEGESGAIGCLPREAFSRGFTAAFAVAAGMAAVGAATAAVLPRRRNRPVPAATLRPRLSVR
ncbi:MAG: hypothetical protein JO345_36955 [Streptosporangiaceae bacterium]|nr:hypothetical protein [Streptosporangiaceae bacterium]